MLEFEKKQLVPKETFLALKIALQEKISPALEYIQINYYFDTKALDMHRISNTLRVRQIGDELSLQYKYNRRRACHAIRLSEEYVEKIAFLPSTLKNPVDDGDTHVYDMLGCVVTCRYDLKVGGYKISLDTNMYLGRVDYEVEIELDGAEAFDEEDEHLRIINGYVGFNPDNRGGKYSRFIERYIDLGLNYLKRN